MQSHCTWAFKRKESECARAPRVFFSAAECVEAMPEAAPSHHKFRLESLRSTDITDSENISSPVKGLQSTTI